MEDVWVWVEVVRVWVEDERVWVEEDKKVFAPFFLHL
jgi:hypothetical protein